MTIAIKVPTFPESISEGTISKWYKKPGDAVKRDEHILDIETDKVVLEVNAPEDGTLEKILKAEGDTVKSEEVVAQFKAGKGEKAEKKDDQEKKTDSTAKSKQAESKAAPKEESKAESKESLKKPKTEKEEISKPEKSKDKSNQIGPFSKAKTSAARLSPSERRKRAEAEQPETEQTETEQKQKEKPKEKETTAKEEVKGTTKISTQTSSTKESSESRESLDRRVPMSRLRAKIAERLVQSQHTAAILTTFNEINMQPVMELRHKYKETFEKTHGVRLGLMSFFTIAALEALKRFPIVNASVDGHDIIYHEYYDIGIAVSSPRGLVVPVIRDADSLHMAQIEKKIAEYGEKAKNGQLTIEEISGGTFTISNGGVFGSLMSTPILNPPQSAILGMHKIEERPIVQNGEIVIRPMMYVALSYDHRIIDGSESVRFLLTIKEMLEEPARISLGV